MFACLGEKVWSCRRVFMVLFQYTILLVIIFMFESVIGLLSYVYQEQIDNDLQDSLRDTFILSYGLVMENTEAVDKIQTKVSSCMQILI